MKTIKFLFNQSNFSSQRGMAPIVLLLFLFILLGLFIGADYAYIYYLTQCGDESISTCFNESKEKSEEKSDETIKEKISVQATGSFTYKNYGVSLSITFPLEGGAVTGSVDGDCSGSVSGNYSGGDNGTISGTIFGSCSPFFVPVPAKGTFSGTVNQQQQTIPINATGSAAGFSGSGSLVLTY